MTDKEVPAQRILILANDARSQALAALVAADRELKPYVEVASDKNELVSRAQKSDFDVICLPQNPHGAEDNQPLIITMANLNRRSKRVNGMTVFYVCESYKKEVDHLPSVNAPQGSPLRSTLEGFKNVVYLRSNFFTSSEVSKGLQACIKKRNELMDHRRVSNFITDLIRLYGGKADVARQKLIDVLGDVALFDLHWLPLLSGLTQKGLMPVSVALDAIERLKGKVDELYLSITIAKIYLGDGQIEKAKEVHNSSAPLFAERLTWLDRAVATIDGRESSNSPPKSPAEAMLFAGRVYDRILAASFKSFEILESLAGRGMFFDAIVHYLNNESVIKSKEGNPCAAIASGTAAVNLCVRPSESTYLCYNLALYHIGEADRLTADEKKKESLDRARRLLQRSLQLYPGYIKASRTLADVNKKLPPVQVRRYVPEKTAPRHRPQLRLV
jgi:hypothetical protein